MSRRQTKSKYTYPTGPGYCGVYTTDRWSVELSISALPHLDWTTQTRVVATNDPQEPGLQLVNQSRGIAECKVENRGHGLIVHVYPDVLRELPGFESGADIRVYQHEVGLTIVPRDGDPFIEEAHQ